MPTLPLPTRALTTAFLSGTLCVAAQADTLVDIYELALENDAQLKALIASKAVDVNEHAGTGTLGIRDRATRSGNRHGGGHRLPP